MLLQMLDGERGLHALAITYGIWTRTFHACVFCLQVFLSCFDIYFAKFTGIVSSKHGP